MRANQRAWALSASPSTSSAGGVHACVLRCFTCVQLFATPWLLCPWGFPGKITCVRNSKVWVAVSSSRRSSHPRDRTHVSCTDRQILYLWTAWEASNAGYHPLTDDLRVESKFRKLPVADCIYGPTCRGMFVSWVFDNQWNKWMKYFIGVLKSKMKWSWARVSLFHLTTDLPIYQDGAWRITPLYLLPEIIADPMP